MRYCRCGIAGRTAVTSGVLFTLFAMSSRSPERFIPASQAHTSSMGKVLHRSRNYGEERSRSRSRSTGHDRLSSSSSPSPSPQHTVGGNTAPSWDMVLSALSELRKDMDELKKDKSGEPAAVRDSAPLPASQVSHASQDTQAGFSGFRSPSGERGSGEAIQMDGHQDSILLQSAKNYGPTDSVSDDLDKEIADMVNHLFINGMKQEDYKDIVEDDVTLRPSNCHALAPVDCNRQVLDALPAEARKTDFRLSEVGKDITKAATIIVKSLTVLDKVASDEDQPVVAKEVAMLNGALALLGNANYRNNVARRHVIKKDINPKYAHLCADKAPITGLLFGDDIAQATKNIEEADKLKSKFACRKTSYPWHSNSSRFGGGRQRKFFAKAPSRGFSSRFQPYGARRTNTGGEARRSYPGQAGTSKNLRSRGLYNPRR